MSNLCFFFFKQKTAYEMRISDWSSDVCSSDLRGQGRQAWRQRAQGGMTMADTLKRYRDKRDFKRTPEPAAGGRPDEGGRAFVIQKHWASRLHSDFRPEPDGAMKSWAVPQGPSYDPSATRLDRKSLV